MIRSAAFGLALPTIAPAAEAQVAMQEPSPAEDQTTYGVLSATVAPRLGLFIPLSDATFLDIAGQYGLFGVERGALLVGLGVWDD